MSDLRQWVAAENNVVVHGPFQATQEYITDYESAVVAADGRETPYWYNANVVFVDVTDLNPTPAFGWFKSGTAWVNGNPTTTVDKYQIVGDGVSAAIVTFSQKGPKAPAKIKFNVNGQDVEETLVAGVATLKITSTNPGDLITVKVGSEIINISVVG